MKTHNKSSYSSTWIATAFASLFMVAQLQAQLPVYESFTYDTGNLSGKGSWQTSVSAIQVATGSLDGTALGLNDSAGNKVTVSGGTAGFNTGTKEDFVTTAITSGSVYFSFLLKLNDATGIDTSGVGTPVLHLNQRGSGTKTVVSILLYNNAGQVEIGIGKHAASTAIVASGFTTNGSGSAIEDGNTYLVVGKYVFNGGSANDTVSLWVNPASLNTASEDASPKVNAIGGGTADSADIGRVYVAQGHSSSIDELRFGATWADVTPSVVCNAASISGDPVSQTAFINGTATFTVAANGTGPSYQWQLSTDNGANWNGAPDAVNAANYITPALLITDSGNKYRCIVSVGCGGGSSVTSAVASLTVTDPTGFQFRSATTGNWGDPNTWEQTTNGTVWFSATSTPNYLSSNITVRLGHIVTVSTPVIADNLTIQAGGEVDVSGVTFTINDDLDAPLDCDVSGTLLVADVTNGLVVVSGTAALAFENGGHYTWANSSGQINIPAATWADGSTCEIQAGNNNNPAGLLNQSFYNFRWGKTSNGKVNLNAQLTTVRHNLNINAATDPINSMRFMDASGTCDLYVGNDVILESGSTTLSGGSAPGTVLNIHVGRNFVINGGAQLDSRSSDPGTSANIIFTNAASVLTNAGSITHSGTGGGCPINWQVAGGATLVLQGGIQLGTANNLTRDSVVVDGTLDLNGNQITGPGDLTINSSGTLIGSGTSQLTTGLNAVNYGGTLNLPNLPNNLNNGDNFRLFDALSYSGTFIITPLNTPGTGFGWDDSQLTLNGTLYVGSAGVPAFRITDSQLDGGNFIINGSGGTPNAGFTVLSSTDVATPIASWATWATGTCDGSGNFTVTNAINPGDTQSYFRVSQP